MKTKYLKIALAVSIPIIIASVVLVIQLRKRSIQQETVRIAFVGPLSGKRASEGQALLQGINLYLDLVNQKGGILGKKVVLDAFDDQDERSRARQQALKIAEQNQAVAVIGHSSGPSSISAGRIYKQFKIPAVSPMSSDAELTEKNDWYFSVMSTDELQGRFLVYYAKYVLQHNTISIIHEDRGYGADLAEVLQDTASSLGMNIKHIWSFRVKDTSLDRVLRHITIQLNFAQARAGAIFLASGAEGGRKVLKALKDEEVQQPIMAVGAMASKAFQDSIKSDPQELANPGYYTNDLYVAMPLLFDSAGQQGQHFKKLFNLEHGEYPNWRAAFGYDAALVIAEAIKYTGIEGTPETIRADRQKIRAYLAGLNTPANSLDGVTGLNYFDAQKHTPKPIALGMYKEGRIIPALTQLSVIKNVNDISDLETLLEQGQVLLIDGQYMYKTNIVYVGTIIHELSEIDWEKLTFKLKCDLWFRHQGQIDVERIEFLNAAEPVTLKADSIEAESIEAEPIEAESIEAEPIEEAEPILKDDQNFVHYHLYQLHGRFKADFQYEQQRLGQHLLSFSFRHRDLPINNLIYVVDLVGMGFYEGSSFLEAMRQAILRGLGSGWLTSRIRFSHGAIEKHAKGEPLYFDRQQRSISYSQFNLGMWVEEDTFSIRNSIPAEFAQYLTLFCVVMLVALRVTTRKVERFFYHRRKTDNDSEDEDKQEESSNHPQRRREDRTKEKRKRLPKPILQILWIFQVFFAMVLLLSSESYFVTGPGTTMSTSLLKRIIMIFDILWWIIPAALFNVAIERFLWYPLENTTGRIIPNLVRRMAGFFIYLLAFFGIVAFVFNQGLTGLMATSGVFAMIIGLAVQMNISNIFSGLAINIEQPFRIGDWVKVGEHGEGRVIDINWRTTRIQTREEHNILSIPNTVASESVIVNYNYPDERYGLRLRLETVPIYRPSEVRKVLLDAVLSVKDVLHEPEPEIEFEGQGDSSAIYGVEFCVKDYEKRDDYMTAVWESVWANLEMAGIEMATPCRHIFEFQGLEASKKREPVPPLTLLHEFDLFQPFPDEIKEALSKRIRSHRVPTDANIMREGEQGDSLFIIIEGVVGIWITLPDGKTIEVARRKAGDIIGEMALLTGEPRTATVKTITPSLLYEITKEDIAPFIETQPDIVKGFSEILAARKLETAGARQTFKELNAHKKALYKQFLGKIQSFFGVNEADQ